MVSSQAASLVFEIYYLCSDYLLSENPQGIAPSVTTPVIAAPIIALFITVINQNDILTGRWLLIMQRYDDTNPKVIMNLAAGSLHPVNGLLFL
jgi:hypothetical protein